MKTRNAILCLFALAAPLRAGELNPAEIPSNAEWLLHADLDSMRGSETGKAVFAEIELSSSHHPWTPVPQMLPWDELDSGRAFRGQRAGQIDSDAMLANDALTRAGYGRSIAYSLEAVVSWLENWPDERHRDLVVVLLGDHQPHTYVTGGDPDRSVPISLIARARRILNAAA